MNADKRRSILMFSFYLRSSACICDSTFVVGYCSKGEVMAEQDEPQAEHQGNAEKLKRLSVPALDEILGVPFKVLDEGFVRVVDYMGSDEAIVQAARVSYGKGTKKVSEDRGLIR